MASSDYLKHIERSSMNNVIDLNKEREIKTLIDKLGTLISVDDETVKRTFDFLGGETMDTDKTKTVSVRFPIELLDWIDRYSRILAVDENKRVTRNMVVINFLETMKAVIEYREQHEFNGTHVEEIEKIIAIAKDQQPEQN